MIFIFKSLKKNKKLVIIYFLKKSLYIDNLKEVRKRGKSAIPFKNTSPKIRDGNSQELNDNEMNGEIKAFDIVIPTQVILKSENKFCVNFIKVSCGHHHTLALADVFKKKIKFVHYK